MDMSEILDSIIRSEMCIEKRLDVKKKETIPHAKDYLQCRRRKKLLSLR